jgi:hypothetical protein
MEQGVVQMPQLALISIAVYSFYLLLGQIWFYKKLKNGPIELSVIFMSYGLLILCLLGITANNMYVFFVDQPILTSGTNEQILASQIFHADLRSLWQPLSLIPLAVDLGALIFFCFKKLNQRLAITVCLIVLILIDISMIGIYFSI